VLLLLLLRTIAAELRGRALQGSTGRVVAPLLLRSIANGRALPLLLLGMDARHGTRCAQRAAEGAAIRPERGKADSASIVAESQVSFFREGGEGDWTRSRDAWRGLSWDGREVCARSRRGQ